jgi:hypothetical protein
MVTGDRGRPRHPPRRPARPRTSPSRARRSRDRQSKRGHDVLLLPVRHEHELWLESPSTDAGLGTTDAPVSADLTGLASSTTYHYRVVAVSSAGTIDGADQTFTTTTPPAVTTGSASRVSHSSAGVTGVVNPEGQATTYYFRYGTTTAYGLQTSPTSVGSGSSPVGVGPRCTG